MRVTTKKKTKIKDGITWVKADNPELRRYLPVFETKKIKAHFNPELFAKIQQVYEKEKSALGYMSFWHLKNLSMREVFECIKAFYQEYPYNVRFQVNRAGQITSFKLLK